MGNERLRATRVASGKTQAQVASEAGIAEAAYQRYEYGQNEPGVRTAIRIADALRVIDLRELFADQNPHRHDNTACQADGRTESR